MKLESLVIAGQLYCGEYVLKSCTHNKSAQQLSNLSGSNPLPDIVCWDSRRIVQYREVLDGGSGRKKQPYTKKPVDLPVGGEGRENSRKAYKDARKRILSDLWRSDAAMPVRVYN